MTKSNQKQSSILSRKAFKVGSAWVLFFIGLIGYILGYFVFDLDTIRSEIVIKIADVLIIGVIIGYLTNAAQFLGVFKAELQSVIFGKEFIKKRNDIQEVWENLTTHLFKEKFPVISQNLLTIIKNNYLPVDVVNYYQDYDVNIELKWADNDHHFIIAEESITFEIIADNENEFNLKLESWLDVEGLSNGQYFSKINEFKVNDIDANIREKKECTENNKYHHSVVVTVRGSKKYDVSQKREKKYLFDRDFDISFKALYLINKMKITFNYPEDLEVNLISRGTINDFKIEKDSACCLRAVYKGLILPRQGYVMVLNRKHNYEN